MFMIRALDLASTLLVLQLGLKLYALFAAGKLPTATPAEFITVSVPDREL